MNEERFLELIGRKMTNSLNSREEQEFNELLDTSHYRNTYNKYLELWRGSREEVRALNEASVFNRLMHKIDVQYGNKEQEIDDVRFSFRWSRRIVAAIIFLVLVPFGLFWILTNDFSADEAIEAKTIVKSNPRGQKSTVFLPDGSRVILNSESTISYSSLFLQETRSVRLNGEAFFEVEHNSDVPFIVNTDNLNVRVLGTSFNVKSFGNSGDIKVSLADGQVEISEKVKNKQYLDKIILSPGQAISYNKEKYSFGQITDFNPEAEYGWKDGLIYFQNAGFEEVINRLSSWYGVDFVIEGQPDKNWRYSGKFDNFALSNVLYALGFTERFEFEINGKQVTIKL